MNNEFVYHVVTERPMKVNQIIKFDGNNHSGVYNRVTKYKDLVNKIYNNPEIYNMSELSHHEKVALRELALEEVRIKKYPNYPSRLESLYVSKELSDAYNWASYFIKLGRKVYQIVKLKINGDIFTGDAYNCFDATLDRNQNLILADNYWANRQNNQNKVPLYETIVNGKIRVIEIIKYYD